MPRFCAWRASSLPRAFLFPDKALIRNSEKVLAESRFCVSGFGTRGGLSTVPVPCPEAAVGCPGVSVLIFRVPNPRCVRVGLRFLSLSCGTPERCACPKQNPLPGERLASHPRQRILERVATVYHAPKCLVENRGRKTVGHPAKGVPSYPSR